MDSKDKLELYKIAVEMVAKEAAKAPGLYGVGKEDWQLNVESKYKVLFSHFEKLKPWKPGDDENKKDKPPRLATV